MIARSNLFFIESKLLIALLFIFLKVCLGTAAETTTQNSPDDEFRTPFRFDPQANGINVNQILLSYLVDTNKIRIANTEISETSFNVQLISIQGLTTDQKLNTQLDAKIDTPLDLNSNDKPNPSKHLILVKIPKSIFSKGDLELILENGETLWSYTYTDEELISAALDTNDIQLLTSNIPEKVVNHINSETKSRFKFCLKYEPSSELFSRICTPYYRLSPTTIKLKMKQETSPYRVFINTQEHEASAEVPVDLNTKIHFFATSGNKYVLEFQSVPLPLFLTDYYKEQETSSHLVLFGHSNTPLNFETLELNNLDKMSFSNQIGWLPTIGDFKKYWKLNLDLNQTDIFLRGDGGGIFTYKLKIPAIPHKNLKPVILNNSVSKTYLSEIKIKFRIPEADKADYMVSTEEKNPLPTEADQQQYVWNFENPNKGEDSSHLLLLTNQQYQWRLSHTIFRGFSSEMSYRIAMVLANGSQVNSLNEFSLNHWFETLFGWDNSLLSFQRWGISLKSFDPIKSFKLKDQTEEEINISTRTLDLKYRLTPGLWEHDETWGLILGYEKVRLNSMNPDLFGFGFFWARSMPKFFDDIFNYIPLLNYPKWVDMDFVFYSSSPNKEVKPGLNYNLNFHGKVLWTKSFFGEGGFGMNSFEFNNIKEETNESLRDFYGTFGLGFNF